MLENHKTTLHASLLVAISGILYGFLGYLGINVLRDEMCISTMLFWRFFIAAIWIFFFIIYKHAKQTTINYPDKFKLMLEGLKHVSSLRASIISVLEPLITMIVGFILLNESISNLQILGAFLILGSTLLVQFNRDI